jgi:hypothetical protein
MDETVVANPPAGVAGRVVIVVTPPVNDTEAEEVDRAIEGAAGTVMDFIITADTGVP